MGNDWKTCLLEEIADEITVGYVGPMASEYVATGVPFLRSLNVDPLRINTNKLKYISSEFHARLSKSRLKPGDVVIVRTGKPGTCAVIPKWLSEANCSDIVVIRPGAQINARFLAYYVNAVAHTYVAAHLVGAVQQHFNIGSARQMPIHHPSIEEQLTIVGILSSLDDKIELNRRMNGVLESMARAIFKAWFIDFEPVRAKAAGATSFPGMPQSVFDGLPDRLVDSELGEIPEGWEVVPIGELVEVVGGGTPRTKNAEYWEGGDNPFCTPRDMSNLTSPVLLDTDRHITQAGVDKISSGQLPVGTVILSSRAPIGYLALAATPVSVNQGIIAMQTGDFPNTYVLLWTEANMDEIKSRASGSTFAEISKRSFRPIPAIRPDSQTLHAFSDMVQPLFESITSNLRESQALANIRDAVLPKLISGELRVCL